MQIFQNTLFICASGAAFITCLVIGAQLYTERDTKFGRGWRNPFVRIFMIGAFIPVVNLLVFILALWFAWLSTRDHYVKKIRPLYEEYIQIPYSQLKVDPEVVIDDKRIDYTHRCMYCYSDDIAICNTVRCNSCGLSQLTASNWRSCNNWHWIINRYLSQITLFEAILIHRKGAIDVSDFRQFATIQKVKEVVYL